MDFANAFVLPLLIVVSTFSLQYSVALRRDEPVNLAYKIYEPECGLDRTLAPILLLHGLTLTKKSWNDTAPALAERSKRKVYALDARDHGDSPYTKYFSEDLNVKDVIHFLDCRNIRKAIIVGHSMGGKTAIYAALKKPWRFEKVFVEDMFLEKLPRALLDNILELLIWRQKSFSHMPKGLSEEEAIKFSNDYIIKNLPKDSPLQGVFDEKAKQELRRTPDGRWALNFNYDVVSQYMKNDPSPFYIKPRGHYKRPAYFMYGGKSFIGVRSDEKTILKHFPRAEFIEFPEAGHEIHATYPEEYVETVVEHL